MVERRAELHLGDLRADALHHVVEDRLVDQDARAGDTGLAGIAGEHRRRGDPERGGFEIGVGEHDVGRLAPELEVQRLERRGGALRDDARGGGGTGEADAPDTRIAHQRVAGLLAETGHDVHDARGKAGFVEQLAESQQRARRLLRGLQHDGVARGERGAELGDGDRERRVPRDDETDDSDRLADREVEAGRPDLHRVAADLVGGAGEVEEHLGARGQVEERRLHDDATVVAGLDLGQLVGVGAHHLGQPAEMAARASAGSVRQHSSYAARAAATASATSVASLRGTVAHTVPVDGSMLSSTAPDRAGRP